MELHKLNEYFLDKKSHYSENLTLHSFILYLSPHYLRTYSSYLIAFRYEEKCKNVEKGFLNIPLYEYSSRIIKAGGEFGEGLLLAFL